MTTEVVASLCPMLVKDVRSKISKGGEVSVGEVFNITGSNKLFSLDAGG
jgi:hypothetical protein